MGDEQSAGSAPVTHPAGTTATERNSGNRDRWNDPSYSGRAIQFFTDERPDEEYAFRWPNSGHIGRYSRETMEGNATKAARNLVVSLLLYPSKEELAARFEELPGLPVALANFINRKTGLLTEFTEKN